MYVCRCSTWFSCGLHSVSYKFHNQQHREDCLQQGHNKRGRGLQQHHGDLHLPGRRRVCVYMDNNDTRWEILRGAAVHKRWKPFISGVGRAAECLIFCGLPVHDVGNVPSVRGGPGLGTDWRLHLLLGFTIQRFLWVEVIKSTWKCYYGYFKWTQAHNEWTPKISILYLFINVNNVTYAFRVLGYM